MDNKEDLKKRVKYDKKWITISLVAIIFSTLINAALQLYGTEVSTLAFFQKLFEYWITPIVSSFFFFLLGLIVQENDSIHNKLRLHKTVYSEAKHVISRSNIEQLTELKALLDANVLTEEEFEAKKKRILNI